MALKDHSEQFKADAVASYESTLGATRKEGKACPIARTMS